MLNNHPLIRTIYLYLFSLVGLIMLTIGSVMLVNLGLKTYIFPKAENDYYRSEPFGFSPATKMGAPLTEDLAKEWLKSDLTQEQKAEIQQWLDDYEKWKNTQITPEEQKSINHQRDAAQAFAFMLVGLPLWLYHWFTIKKEVKN